MPRSSTRPNRNRLISVVVLMAAVQLAASTGRSMAGVGDDVVTWSVRTMGTWANLTVVTADSAAAEPAARAAASALARVDSLMSNWTDTSELARINRVAGTSATEVDAEVAPVIDFGLSVWRESGGAFDMTVEPLVRAWGFLGGEPHVPTDEEIARAYDRIGSHRVGFDPDTRTIIFAQPDIRIDLGGIAKGYGVDRAAATLRTRGYENGLLDLSGNMVAMGHPPGRDAWNIGVRDPRDRVPYFATVRLRDRCVATSGIYEQFVAADGEVYGHILDPRSGEPASGLISVTVVADDAMTADAWGTALFVLGLDAARQTARERDDLDVVLVSPGAGSDPDTCWVEESFRDTFETLPEATPWMVTRRY